MSILVAVLLSIQPDEPVPAAKPSSGLSQGSFFPPAVDWVPRSGVTASGTRWGFVDSSGKWTIPPQFEEVRLFSTELYSTPEAAGCITLAMVRANGKFGFIDVGGRYCVAPRYDECTGFADRWAAVRVGSKWGYINTVGHVMIDPRFDAAFPYDEITMEKGRALVRIDGALHIIDRSGMVVDDRPLHDFAQGPLLVDTGEGFLLLDSEGSEATPDRFSMVGSFSCGRARVTPVRGNLSGYLDLDGKMVIPAEFVFASDFRHGIAFVIPMTPEAGTSVFRAIDPQGRDVIAPFPRSEYRNILVPVKVDGLWGYVDHTGGLAIPPQFEEAAAFDGGRALVRIGPAEAGGPSKWFMIDRQGKRLCETRPDAEKPDHSASSPGTGK